MDSDYKFPEKEKLDNENVQSYEISEIINDDLYENFKLAGKTSEEKVDIITISILSTLESLENANEEEFPLFDKELRKKLLDFRKFMDKDRLFVENVPNFMHIFGEIITRTSNLNINVKTIGKIVQTLVKAIEKADSTIHPLMEMGLIDICIRSFNTGIYETGRHAIECLTKVGRILPELIPAFCDAFCPNMFFEFLTARQVPKYEAPIYGSLLGAIAKLFLLYLENGFFCDPSQSYFPALMLILDYIYKSEYIDSKASVFKCLELLISREIINFADMFQTIHIDFAVHFNTNRYTNGYELCNLMRTMYMKGWDGAQFPYNTILYFIANSYEIDETYHIIDTLAFAIENSCPEFKSMYRRSPHTIIIFGFLLPHTKKNEETGEIIVVEPSFNSKLKMGHVLVSLFQDAPEDATVFFPESYNALLALFAVDEIELIRRVLSIFIAFTLFLTRNGHNSVDELLEIFNSFDGENLLENLEDFEEEDIDTQLLQIRQIFGLIQEE